VAIGLNGCGCSGDGLGLRGQVVHLGTARLFEDDQDVLRPGCRRAAARSSEATNEEAGHPGRSRRGGREGGQA